MLSIYYIIILFYNPWMRHHVMYLCWRDISYGSLIQIPYNIRFFFTFHQTKIVKPGIIVTGIYFHFLTTKHVKYHIEVNVLFNLTLITQLQSSPSNCIYKISTRTKQSLMTTKTIDNNVPLRTGTFFYWQSHSQFLPCLHISSRVEYSFYTSPEKHI